MAFLLKTSISSHLRSSSEKIEHALTQQRGYHIELGAREKALVAPDPVLKRFKSHKKGVQLVKRLGDVLTIAIVAGSCYEIYVRAVMREEARKQA